MFIRDNFKLLFIHPPKTGGISIGTFLLENKFNVFSTSQKKGELIITSSLHFSLNTGYLINEAFNLEEKKDITKINHKFCDCDINPTTFKLEFK
jgi:hypothetical protein